MPMNPKAGKVDVDKKLNVVVPKTGAAVNAVTASVATAKLLIAEAAVVPVKAVTANDAEDDKIVRATFACAYELFVVIVPPLALKCVAVPSTLVIAKLPMFVTIDIKADVPAVLKAITDPMPLVLVTTFTSAVWPVMACTVAVLKAAALPPKSESVHVLLSCAKLNKLPTT